MRYALRALLASAALAATVAIAAPAAAAGTPPVITLSSFGDPNTLPAGQVLVADFNNLSDKDATSRPDLFALDLGTATVGVNEGQSGYSGSLANDPTTYLTIPGGSTVVFTSLKDLTSFSFYMVSPDTYNTVHFFGANGYDVLVSGTTLVAGDTNQQWSWGKRVNFDFGDATVNRIEFSSGQNSFEIDNLAAGAVPEPMSWALMIMGFGGIGAMVRRRRAVAAATFA